MTRLTANSLLLLAASIWGSAFVAQATAMDSMGPLAFTGIRFLIAAACVAPFAFQEQVRRPDAPLKWSHLVAFGLVGLIFFFGIILQQVGLMVTTVTNAGFLTALYVVLVPIFGFLVFKEKPHPILLPSAFVALFGIWLLGGGGLADLNWGDGAMVICAMFWALHVGLIGRLGAQSGRPLALAFIQFLIVGGIGLAAAWLVEDVTVAAMKGAWVELLYTSVISGGLAFTLQVMAQRWTQAADAAILLSSEALFAALFGTLLLGERMDAAGIAGCSLIFGAILAVQLVPIVQSRYRARAAGAANR